MSQGFPCIVKLPSPLDLEDIAVSYHDIHFPNEKAVYTISLKLAVASDYLKAGCDILYSDVDAVWIRNPLDDMKINEADFLFQPGSFPDCVKQRWGFAICSGFFYMRSCLQNIEIAKLAQERFDGDDQRTLNDIIINDFEIVWSKRPEKWENCSLESGWTAPISGVCAKTGLNAVALPHVFYQRHGTQRDECAHAIVCHPNSPKDQEGKFAIFEELGINLNVPLKHDPDALNVSNRMETESFLERLRGFWRSLLKFVGT